MMERIKITYANMRAVAKRLNESGQTCVVGFSQNPKAGIMGAPVSTIKLVFSFRTLYAGDTVIFHENGTVEYEA